MQNESNNSGVNIGNGNLTQAKQYYNKGNALATLDKYSEAIDCFDKAIELNPNHARAYSNKGNALYDLDNYSEAIDCFDKAIELNPNHAHAYSNKGNALYDLGKHSEAIDWFDQAIKLNPNYAPAYINKGNALYDLGKYSEAIDCFDKAIELNPNHAPAYCNKGTVLATLDNYSEGIDCFDKAIELNPNLAQTYSNKGNALHNLGKHSEAIVCFDKAIFLVPNIAIYYCSKGKALNKLGEENEALECFNKAYEISKTGNLGNELSQGNINYINDVISKDREELLKKFAQLQETTIETANTINKLDQGTPEAEQTIIQFNQFKKDKETITEKVIEALEDKPNHSSLTKSNEAVQLLLEEMRKMQIDIQTLKQNGITIIEKQEQFNFKQNDISLEIKAGFSEIKKQQQSQEKFNHEVRENLNKAINKLQEKQKAENKAIEDSISNIYAKIQLLAKQEDVETITKEVMNLALEGRITKGKLEDIEEDVDNILERQDKIYDRLSAIESFQVTVKEFNLKLQNNNEVFEQDKIAIQAEIQTISKNISTFATQATIQTINDELKDIITNASFTKTKLNGLNTKVHNLISKQEKQIAVVNMVNEIIYDNPLLNDKNVVHDVAKLHLLNDMLDLSYSISLKSMSETSDNYDLTTLIGGCINLNHHQ